MFLSSLLQVTAVIFIEDVSWGKHRKCSFIDVLFLSIGGFVLSWE